MKKRYGLILLTLIVVLVIITFIIINPFKNTQLKETKGVTIVPTLEDTIDKDSSWCGTFQLVWNDLKKNIVKKDIVFNPQERFAENLNKEEFNENMINQDSYYKIFGLKTLDLKKTIEKEIKNKFNQSSDILNQFNWDENNLNNENDSLNKRYFLYTMLYKEFEFTNKFDKLKNADFGNYSNIKYFGINNKTNYDVGKQVTVLYYNGENDFAILISTQTNDEIIFYKNPIGDTFYNIYENMLKNEELYDGTTEFKENDELKIPYLNFNILKDYTELKDKKFETENGEATIAQAVQSINFSLNEKGGKIKSESGIDVKKEIASKNGDPRYFNLNNTFAIFIRESGEELPYFAARIDDITKFQQ